MHSWLGAQRPLGRMYSSLPPLFYLFYFCWALLKAMRPHNRRLSASLLGRESLIITLGSRSELHPRESRQIDSLPADWDSRSLVRKWEKLLPGGKKVSRKVSASMCAERLYVCSFLWWHWYAERPLMVYCVAVPSVVRLPSTLSVTTQTAGRRTKNRGCAESHKFPATLHIPLF